MMVKRVKTWYESRIVWVNVLHGAFSAAVMVLPLLQAELSLRWYAAANIAVNALLVGLRFATTDPVIVSRIRQDEYDV